jgi:hypothetical protein
LQTEETRQNQKGAQGCLYILIPWHNWGSTGTNVQYKQQGNVNIYVGNLSREVTEQDLRQAFEAFGQVESVTVIKDKFSGESKGFGFIEMPTVEEVVARSSPRSRTKQPPLNPFAWAERRSPGRFWPRLQRPCPPLAWTWSMFVSSGLTRLIFTLPFVFKKHKCSKIQVTQWMLWNLQEKQRSKTS